MPANPPVPTPLAYLDAVVAEQKAGVPRGITAVCSAHPIVLDAAIAHAVDGDEPVLIEATSNQVDQYGGYTGMRPAGFRDLVHELGARRGLPGARIILGGDHLGPNRWTESPADRAMDEAEALVVEYVQAGFTKIHLDCSFPCRGDAEILDDATVAARAARLAAAADRTASRCGTAAQVRYVIGTEVPAPGGARHTIDALQPTPLASARASLAANRAALAAADVEHLWPQVTALVVQPGVEFDHMHVVEYDPTRTTELRTALDDQPNMIFEAHSTDYQSAGALGELVAHHWAILKVGPELTFALREGLFALAAIESELITLEAQSALRSVVDRRMEVDPRYWASYYEAGAGLVERHYSYSDRIRYYWSDQDVVAAQNRLLANLSRTGIPAPLLSQYLPDQYRRVRDGRLDADPRELLVDRVRDVLRRYDRACRRGQYRDAAMTPVCAPGRS